MPQFSKDTQPIPEALKAYAGVYDMGVFGGFIDVQMEGDELTITPIGVRNERAQVYIYNGDAFISTEGNYVGMNGLSFTQHGIRGISSLQFTGSKYIFAQSYEAVSGLGQTAMAMPFAQKVEANEVSQATQQQWEARAQQDYLLVSEKYSAFHYFNFGLLRIKTDDRVKGYIMQGLYHAAGKRMSPAKMIDETKSVGYQDIPTMAGRDTNDICAVVENGVEYIYVNDYKYQSAAHIKKTSDVTDIIEVSNETVWFQVDDAVAGQKWRVVMPEHGAWFIYDDHMNCISSSLEKEPQEQIILPKGGRLAFAGDPGAQFEILK